MPIVTNNKQKQKIINNNGVRIKKIARTKLWTFFVESLTPTTIFKRVIIINFSYEPTSHKRSDKKIKGTTVGSRRRVNKTICILSCYGKGSSVKDAGTK